MFFNAEALQKTIPQIQYEEETKTVYLFQIIAHAFLVLYRQDKLGTDLSKYQSLLERHTDYFPKQLPIHVRRQSVKQQIDYLLTYNQPVREVVEPALAYTLQQLCVDVMCEKPAIYGNLIVEGHEPKALRKMDRLDAPAAIQILASEILGVNIFVERHNDNYFLPVREYYLSNQKGSADIFLHFQDKSYMTPSDMFDLEDEVA